MPDLKELLDDERRRAARPSRAPRIAIVVAAVGGALALGAGVTLAASAATSIAGLSPAVERVVAEETATAAPSAEPEASEPVDQQGAPDAAADQAADPAEAADPAAEDPAEVDPALPPGAVALMPGGTPVYDETTDIELIEGTPEQLAENRIWLVQHRIIADCMAEQGYGYRFTVFWQLTPEDETATPPYDPEIDDDYREALMGPPDQPSGEEYDWQQAGCIGYAVHVTGMDDAN